MKLTTAETKKYALLVVKASTGGLNTTDRTAYESLVGKMAKPEPRKPNAKKATTSKAAGK
ncbi:hypothetical protein QMK33_19785 [Hymenobacter sp. H14-R3]|uniref:hypothetical protein n=1 Tax=Hymenobacter sp. H14-R3 TaxID=3046308 RepID=UPI0024BB1F5F|nr:hypothetical protein [Hymenobacter sp. H14-R3]MDJ0367396.1 hypothetical protein [Hymenobacter sp. H14-R3]